MKRIKINIKFFRTFSSTPHKKGCLNEVVYEDTIEETRLKDLVSKINLSNKHIINKLESAFDKFKNKNIEVGTSNSGKGAKTHTKNNGSKTKGNEAELFDEGMESKDGKEPYIITRIYNEIETDDDTRIRCIIGCVHDIQLMVIYTLGIASSKYRGEKIDNYIYKIAEIIDNNSKEI